MRAEARAGSPSRRLHETRFHTHAGRYAGPSRARRGLPGRGVGVGGGAGRGGRARGAEGAPAGHGAQRRGHAHAPARRRHHLHARERRRGHQGEPARRAHGGQAEVQVVDPGQPRVRVYGNAAILTGTATVQVESAMPVSGPRPSRSSSPTCTCARRTGAGSPWPGSPPGRRRRRAPPRDRPQRA